MKKIFVTGGSGFLGKFLIEQLKKKYHVTSPNSTECDLILYKNLKKYKTRFHYIFHLAAWTQAGDFCLKFPGDQWLINQQINTNVLKWWKEDQAQAKLIFIGTSCSYPEGLKLVETNYMKKEPIKSLYTYAMTKRMLLQGAKALQEQYNMKWLCLVPSTLYGSSYHTDGRQMHFIFDLITKILKGKFFGTKVILWGNGLQKREIIHVNDFVKNSLKVFSKINNEVLNIGSGKDYKIKEFAKKICNIVDYDFNKIYFDKKKYTGAKSKKLDIQKVKKIIPNYLKSQINLNNGISDTIDWVKINILKL